jgi:HEAT repeat protein
MARKSAERNGEPESDDPRDEAGGAALGARTSPREIARRMVEATLDPEKGLGSQNHFDIDAKSKLAGGWKAVALALREMLNDPDASICVGAAVILVGLDRHVESATKAIRRLLGHANGEIRLRCALTFALLGKTPDALLDDFGRLLHGDDPVLAVAAACCLKETEMAPEAIRLLGRALNHQLFPEFRDFPQVAVYAALALLGMGLHTAEALDVFRKALTEPPTPEIRRAVIHLLPHLGEKASEVGRLLIAMLGDGALEKASRRYILRTLGDMNLGDDARKALLRAARSKNWTTVCSAADGFREIGELPAELLNTLIGLLDHGEANARCSAASALGSFGAAADAAVPALLARLGIEPDMNCIGSLLHGINGIGWPISPAYFPVAQETVRALIGRIKPEHPLPVQQTLVLAIVNFRELAIPILIEHARADSGEALRVASGCLAGIGTLMQDMVIAELTANFVDEGNEHTRVIAAVVLSYMGAHAAKGVRVLVRLLDDEPENDNGDSHVDVTIDILNTLRAIGREARDAAPAVVRKLLGADLFVAELAQSVLMAIGPEAVPALDDAVPEADAEGRERIAEVVRRIGRPAGAAGHGQAEDFSWFGDDELLRDFVRIADVMVKYPTLSMRKIEEKGLVGFRQTKIRKVIARVEEKYNARNRTTYRVREEKERDSTRVTGLTEFGKSLLTRIRKYLESMD